MKKHFWVSRKIIIPTEDQYQNVVYEHGMGVEYDASELEELTIIESSEFKELLEAVDKAQRKAIKKDTGLEELPIDAMIITSQRRSLRKKRE